MHMSINIEGENPLHVQAGLYPLGNNLVNMEIQTFGDVKNFFNGINNYATGLVSDNSSVIGLTRLGALQDSSFTSPTFGDINFIELGNKAVGLELQNSVNFDSAKVLTGISSVLAYGQAVQEEAPFFFSNNGRSAYKIGSIGYKSNTFIAFDENITSPFVYKPLSFDINTVIGEISFLEEKILKVQKNAEKDIRALEAKFDKERAERDAERMETEKEKLETSKELDAWKKKVESLQEQVTLIQKAILPLHEKDITYGPLRYTKGVIFINDSAVSMKGRQLTTLCALLMEAHDELVLDETLRFYIGSGVYLDATALGKLANKVRKIFRENKCKMYIKRVNSSGFMMSMKKIR